MLKTLGEIGVFDDMT